MQFNIKYEDIKNFLSSQGYEMRALNKNYVENNLRQNKSVRLYLFHNGKQVWYTVNANGVNFTMDIFELDFHKDWSKQWRVYLKNTYNQPYINYIGKLYLKHKQSLAFYENVLEEIDTDKKEILM